ncbi:MAG TPA: hypothetical protein VNZ53_04085 [Steroidobacteraceae bacterium]|jgi:hypothetical protein|nr:hypothetical protein [Steroidobacteraceae bacterium]
MTDQSPGHVVTVTTGNAPPPGEAAEARKRENAKLDNVVALHGKPGHNSKAALREQSATAIKQTEEKLAAKLKPAFEADASARAALEALDAELNEALAEERKLVQAAHEQGSKACRLDRPGLGNRRGPCGHP